VATPPAAGTRTVFRACFFDSIGKPTFEENSAQPTRPGALDTPETVASMRLASAAVAAAAQSASATDTAALAAGRRREEEPARVAGRLPSSAAAAARVESCGRAQARRDGEAKFMMEFLE
jgi:hypothetical protein